jgi:O-antigen ligase
MGHALLIVGIASLIVAVAFPSIGVMHGTPGGGLDPTESKLEGAWQGVLVHKNTLGWISICGSQVYAWRFLNEKPQRWKHGAVILLFVFLGIKCHSATALVSIIAGFLLLPALRVRHWSGVPRLWVESLLVLAVILLTVVVSLDLQNAAAIVGKDVTLTGRIPLWEVLIDSIKARPWLGYGYSGFWLDPNPEAQRVWALVHWKPPQAHNAYIDAALEVGIPGAIVATLLMFNVIRKSLRLCTDRYLVWATYVALFSILFAVTNLVETRLFRPGDNYCFMLALCYFALVKETHTRKLHERITKMKTRRALTGAFRLGEDPEQLAADEVR